MQITKTRAAILVEQNKSLTVADIDLPAELSFGQVLVKVQFSGICGAQINEIEGAKGPVPIFMPMDLLAEEIVTRAWREA